MISGNVNGDLEPTVPLVVRDSHGQSYSLEAVIERGRGAPGIRLLQDAFNSRSMSDNASPRSSTCGRSVCLRENASNCRTSVAARVAFCFICMMS